MHLKSKLCNTDCRKLTNFSKSMEVFLIGSLIIAGTHVNSFFQVYRDKEHIYNITFYFSIIQKLPCFINSKWRSSKYISININNFSSGTKNIRNVSNITLCDFLGIRNLILMLFFIQETIFWSYISFSKDDHLPVNLDTGVLEINIGIFISCSVPSR